MSTHSQGVVEEFKDICWHFPVHFVGTAFVFERVLARRAGASRVRVGDGGGAWR